jgi:manganese/zinc/iron transport system permease protein
MVAMGGDGRSLPGLFLGAGISAGLGLLAVHWIVTRTRLAEDAAIGAVLSVFFGAGIVLLAVMQTMSAGRQAGLEGFLLGATAGMLSMIAAGAALALALVYLLRRPMILAAFDPGHAAAFGAVGSIIVIAMFVCPPAAARLMTDRPGRQVAWSAAFAARSAIAGYVLAGYGPGWFGSPHAVGAAGMIATVSGAILAAACLFGPRRRRIAV